MSQNQVLVPIDRSPFSMSIVPQVKRFLDPQRNTLILFHVAEEPTPAELRRLSVNEYANQLERLRTQLRTQIQEELETLSRELTALGFQVQVVVRFGEPITQIEHYIGTQTVDLVAMSTHGRSGLGRMLFGSVAQELLQQLSLPILLLRPALAT